MIELTVTIELEDPMWNRTVEIDRTHCRAICTEIGERLRTSLAEQETAEPSLQIRHQLEQLREVDDNQAS